ncbi:type IV pilin-like G/H family protein [Coleofasciculus sp. FACHB-T130]|nr:type IV pilin-like G/H family protein [Coleofasciculus sp. FACHB-T130]MBD1877725.1 type IV pilin-like G/H family protein [Coleofasciculus sp. FACHB-T130]
MSIYFRAKWLQFLFKKHKIEGIAFYLRLLVLMVIFGVLAVIALPMVFPEERICGGKGRLYGQIYIGVMNKAQQYYYLENGAFVDSIPKLGTGIKTENKNYEYFARATKTAVFHYAIAQKTASDPLKSYVGAVFIVPTSKVGKKAAKNNKETLAIICVTDTPTSQIPAEPTYQKGVLACGSNTQALEVPEFMRIEEEKRRRRDEGKLNILSKIKGQQAFYLESGIFFAPTMSKLGMGVTDITGETTNYEYSVRRTKTELFNYAIAQKTASDPLKSYVGAVFIVPTSKVGKKAAKNNKEVLAIVCETNTPTSQIPAEPTYQKGVLACGSNTHSIPYSIP